VPVIERREVLRLLTSVSAGTLIPALVPTKSAGQVPVRYEAYGRGPTLFLGSPIGVNKSGQGTDPIAALRQGYLDRLTDRYQVIVMDYPPSGVEAAAAVGSFDPDRVCADVIAVANAAGAERFAWYGYSWGGVVGLQLAARTDRLSALICGGWPPIGASYRDMTAVSEWLAQRAGVPEAQLMVTFYRALNEWRDVEAVSRFTCPRMAFAGGDDVITTGGYTTRIGPLLEERRADLERLGWTVRLVDKARHDLFTRPDVVVPLLREFLDPILLRS
jgi:pimeloyl-ACP methyl ester carboxylesterase